VIKVVPHPLPRPPAPAKRVRRARGRFRFLSMFDTRSTSARKNPMGAVEAFKRAFQPNNRHASLVVKVAHADTDGSALSDLEDAIAGWPAISLLTKHLTDAETLQLIAGADCLVSLHRSEGFGLTVAEAMSVGTPSIITGWSAPVEFSKGAAIEIDYTLVPVIDNSKRYEGFGQLWADPDLDHAAREMRELAADTDRWTALSSAGLEIARDRLKQQIPATDYRRFLATAGENIDRARAISAEG
jgi:glycosyltransferase involved in cell wall biosynthesis